jgi:NAD(P)-dependent dehydrogenase (short-subunit alcohol dehydrogenase family)
MAPFTLSEYDPKTAIPSLSGKVILITGGTAGLGTECILKLLEHHPQVILFTGRNSSSADKVIKAAKNVSSTTQVQFVQCDFTSLHSVKGAAQKILATTSRLDTLICNAGVMAIPKDVTQDGYEIQFGINHLAHAMLIKHLLPLLLSTAKTDDVRIVTLTSLGFKFATTIPFDKLRTENDSFVLGAFRRYGDSKLANILYTQQLAKRYPEILSVVVHPGVVETGLVSGLSGFNRYFTYATTIGMRVSVQDGVKNQLWAATGNREEIVNGGFYEPVGKVGGTTKASRDEKLAEKLWDWTQEELSKF